MSKKETPFELTVKRFIDNQSEWNNMVDEKEYKFAQQDSEQEKIAKIYRINSQSTMMKIEQLMIMMRILFTFGKPHAKVGWGQWCFTMMAKTIRWCP